MFDFKNAFNNVVNNVQEKYKVIQEENALYNQLLETTGIINKYLPVPAFDKRELTLSYKEFLSMCPDLNDYAAQVIRKLLDLNEVCLTVMYSKESKSGMEYYLVPTDRCLWFINVTKYSVLTYENLSVSYVKSNVMSKVLNINNILFNVNGTDAAIDNFMKIINDKAFRDNLIETKMKKYCDIRPVKSYINDLGAGISVDEIGNIVFHTNIFNNKYNISEISNYELLLDDIVVAERKSFRRVRLTSNKNSCMEMAIRVTVGDKVFNLPIIEKSSFGDTYQATSEVYIAGRKFALDVMSILDDLDEKKLNGEL